MSRMHPRYIGLRTARALGALVGGVLAVLLTLFVVGSWVISASLRESRS